MDTTITVPDMPQIAERFAEEDSAKRRYLELQLQFKLYEMLFGPDERTFEEIANELGRQAQANGLTPEILNEILNEN